MAVYEVFNWLGGISDFDDRGIKGAFKFGSNLNIRKVVNSLVAGQALVDEGSNASQSTSASQSPSASLSPSVSPSVSPSRSPSPSLGTHSQSASPSPSASVSPSASLSQSSSVSLSPSPSAGLTTVFAGLIHTLVKCTDGNTYGFDNTGRIYKRDSGGNWTQVYKDPDGAIKGAAEWPLDTGKTYLYWACDTELKRKEIPGVSSWNDVTTVADNLTSATWHTIREAGGALMIANKTALAMVGYDGSYTNEALDLIPGNIANTLVERNGRVIIGTARSADPTRGVNAAIDSEVPLAQVGNDGEIFYANMTDSIPVKRFPGGGQVNPDGVTNEVEEVNFFEWEQNALSWIDKQAVGNLSLWGVYSADSGYNGIYALGRSNKNHAFTMNLDYLLSVDEIGAMANVNGTLVVSYKSGSDFGVKAVDSTTKAQGVYEGLDFHAPIKKPASITTWDVVEMFMAPLPSGASVQFWYKLNKTGSFIQAYTADGATSFSTANGKKAVFRIGAEGEIFEPRMVLNPSGNNSPEIYRLRVYFQ